MSIFSAFLPRNYRLLKAVKQGDLKAVKELIDENVNVDMMSRRGDSVLSIAYSRNHIEIARDLLLSGAEMEDKFALAMLLKETEQGRTFLISALIEVGVDINQTNKFGTSPLLLAAAGNHFDSVKQLLKAGANVDHQDENGLTALIVCADKGHEKITELLIEYGADVNLSDKTGLTAIERARKNENSDLVELLSSLSK